jgi:hypothetical protein
MAHGGFVLAKTHQPWLPARGAVWSRDSHKARRGDLMQIFTFAPPTAA